MKYDIDQLQTAQSREEFDAAVMMFYTKWLERGDDSIDDFIMYFDATWVSSGESNWFTGAGPIDNQNGLESINGDLKKTKIFRLKQKLGDFISTALTVVEQFSHKDDSRLYCPISELIKLSDKTSGYQWLQINQSPSSIVKIKDVYYVLSSKVSASKNGPSLPEMAKQFIKKQKSFNYDSFAEWGEMKNSVYELKHDKDRNLFRCSCVYGQKWIFCKHAVGCMIKFGGLVIPEHAMSVPLHEHRPRGRPKKNRGWWSHE